MNLKDFLTLEVAEIAEVLHLYYGEPLPTSRIVRFLRWGRLGALPMHDELATAIRRLREALDLYPNESMFEFRREQLVKAIGDLETLVLLTYGEVNPVAQRG